jgi:hypothetical protein
MKSPSEIATRHITFIMPPASESPFLFRRALLAAIRSAISEAHVDGQIDVQTTVAALGALPMTEPRPSAEAES